MAEAADFRTIALFKDGRCRTEPEARQHFDTLDYEGEASLAARAVSICMDCDNLKACRTRALDPRGVLVRRAEKHGIRRTVVGTVELINNHVVPPNKQSKLPVARSREPQPVLEELEPWMRERIEACHPDDIDSTSQELLIQINRGVIGVDGKRFGCGRALSVLSPLSRRLALWYYGLDEVVLGGPIDVRVFRPSDPAKHFKSVVEPLINEAVTIP